MPFPPLPPALAQALAEKGYAEPTPVQAAVLEPGLAGRDLLVSAQTGSGKTLAYGLAMAADILAEGADAADGRPLALVVAPTRELALQVERELGWLYGHTPLRVVPCVGGMEIRREQRQLAQGAGIVVGTPGRLRDHLERGNLDAGALRAVVLDEADEMLDLGFRDDLEAILDATPAERRTLLFSATLPREIAALAKRYQQGAARIAASAKDEPHGDIEYRAVHIAPNEGEHAVVNVLRYFEARGALVFCSTREAVRHLHGSLLERGFAAVALSGELGQSERNRALQSLRDGRARVCVATDVAARGIDLPDLGLVVHADLPQNRETLLHRSGRTGRAGRKGVSVLLVPLNQRRRAERLLAAARVDALWTPPPMPDAIRARDQERLAEAIHTLGEPVEEDLAAARALLAERGPEAIAAARVRLHRERLPAPEELYDGGAEPERPGRGQPREAEGGDGSAWFKMNVGRHGNADPRWLLPFICRRGHVTRREVGAIRILERETRFEIAGHAAGRFQAALQQTAAEDEGIRIEPLRESGGEDRPRHRPRGDSPTGRGPDRHGRAAAGDGPRRRTDGPRDGTGKHRRPGGPSDGTAPRRRPKGAGQPAPRER
jgi:ATP-dependent RNA helicase DeaD